MKNYLEKYSDKKVSKHQEGGQMMNDPAQAAPQGGGPDIEGMIMAAYDSQDPTLALEAINAIAEAMMGAQGGGGQAPAEGAMPMARKGMRMAKTPVFKAGGKL